MTADNGTGHPARVISLAVVIVILMALLVFPGFLAAGLSRGERPVVMLVLPPAGSGPFKGAFFWYGPLWSAAHIIFAPANKLMQVSFAMREFYIWQYNLAGGALQTPPYW